MEHSTLQGRFQARFFWTVLALLALAVFPLVAPALGLDFYISFVRRVLIYALAATSLNPSEEGIMPSRGTWSSPSLITVISTLSVSSGMRLISST